MLQGFKFMIAMALALFVSASVAADMQQCQQAYRENHVVQAYDRCLPLAQVGDPEAAFILARLHALGINGAAPDWEKVLEWLTISAAGGNAEAAYNLAVAYQKGKGTPVDLQQSVNYYRQSAERGNAKAMRNLAMLYEKGEGVEKDIIQAFALYQRSAEAGLSDSQLKAGLMLLQGEGVEQDSVAARRLIELSAISGNDKAQLALGVLLSDYDPDTAVYWYRQSASAGNTYAAHNLALIYFQGQGVSQDLLQALAYADASVEHGNLESLALYDKILAALQQSDVSLQSPDVARVSPVSSVTPASSVAPDIQRRPEKQYDPAALLQDIDWLKVQPLERYTVQLARLTKADAVKRFIQDYRLQKIAHAVRLSEHDYVVLLRDSFGDRYGAQGALKAQLPDALAKEAWVRSYRSLYAN